MNQTYYVFRHGKAIENGNDYGESVLTASLLPESIPIIKRMSHFLLTIPNSKNFSSEILRCKQTTEIITSITNKAFIFDTRLNEFYKENFIDFSKRVASFLNENCFFQDGPFLICTHAAVIAALKHFILNREFTIENQLDYTLPGELLIINDDKTTNKMDFNVNNNL